MNKGIFSYSGIGILFAVFLLVMTLWLPDSLAATATNTAANTGYLSGYEQNPAPSSQGSWWLTATYIISMFVVFAFVVCMAYFASKFLGGRFSANNGNSTGQLLEHVPLGPNKSVCVVELAGKFLILGVTGQQINLLGEVEDPQEIERLKRQAMVQPISSETFSRQISSLEELTRRAAEALRNGLHHRR